MKHFFKLGLLMTIAIIPHLAQAQTWKMSFGLEKGFNCRAYGNQCDLRYALPEFKNLQISLAGNDERKLSIQIDGRALSEYAAATSNLLMRNRSLEKRYLKLRFFPHSAFTSYEVTTTEKVDIFVPPEARMVEVYFYAKAPNIELYVSDFGRNFILPLTR